MGLIERGKVQSGGIVFLEPLTLPDGTEVVVHIEPVATDKGIAVRSDSGNFSSLPFFGMWADRKEMGDSAAWVRKEREKWHHRTVE